MSNTGNKKIDQALHVLKVASRGLGYTNESQGFYVVQQDLDLDSLLEADTLAPVLLSMIDMHFENLGIDPEFKTFFPVQLEKKSKSLTFAILKPKTDFNIEESGYSVSASAFVALDLMEKLFHPNPKNQVELDHLVKMWRKELAPYKEGEIIDIRKHKENLFEGSLCLFPKLREDLREERKNNLKKDLFAK